MTIDEEQISYNDDDYCQNIVWSLESPTESYVTLNQMDPDSMFILISDPSTPPSGSTTLVTTVKL